MASGTRFIVAVRRDVRAALVALVTPLLEKNPVKTVGMQLPLVFSMARLIVLAFAVGMLHQIWRAGIAAWPEATLSIAIVLALPLLGALDKVDPSVVVDLGKTLLERFGTGGVRTISSLYAREPSKFDDHTRDGE